MRSVGADEIVGFALVKRHRHPQQLEIAIVGAIRDLRGRKRERDPARTASLTRAYTRRLGNAAGLRRLSIAPVVLIVLPPWRLYT